MAGLLIRPAEAADADAVRELVRAAYRHYVARIGREPWPMTQDYDAVLSGGHTWVAESRGRLTGVLVLVPADDHLLVENLAVDPSAQGHGVGGALLAHAEAQARQLDRPELRLYTNAAMTENLAYYPRRGFSETHRAAWRGFDRVYFVKSIR